MSFDVNWNIDKYKEDHESEDHWLLRRDFMEKWKHNYPEERLVCLARAFANTEFMGCRYPQEVMQEVARMSKEVNKNVTYNDNNANFFDDGRSLGQYSTSAGSTVPQNAAGARSSTSNAVHTTNIHSGVGSVLNQNSALESNYVWSQYSSEVMQGPVSISKVLQTTHSKSFIRENIPKQTFGNLTWHKSSKTNMQQPSQLSHFINHRDGTQNSSSKYASSESTLYRRRERNTVSHFQNSDVHNTGIPQVGIQSSKWPTNLNLGADHAISPMSVVGNAQNSAVDVDMRFRAPVDVSHDQNMPNYDGSSHDMNLHCNTDVGVSQTIRNYDEISVQKPNTYPNRHILVDGSFDLTNSSVEPTTSEDSESTLPQKFNKTSGYQNHENNGEKAAKLSKRKYRAMKREKQLKGAKSKRYKYWVHVGKSPQEARELCETRLNKIPEYKELKKTMGTANYYNKAFLKFAHKKWPGRNPPPKCAYQMFEKIYVPKLKKQSGMPSDISNLSTTGTIGATSSEIGVVTSNTGEAASNTVTTENEPNAAVNKNVGERIACIMRALGITSAAEKSAFNDEYQTRVKNWRSKGKTKNEARSLVLLSFDNYTQIKLHNAKSIEMRKKLAFKEHFKESKKEKTPPNVYAIDTSERKEEANDPDLIEISHDVNDTAGQRNAAKIYIAEDKRRIWWMQQGKTEEEAAILSQNSMPISEALEKIAEHKEVTDKELDKNIPPNARTQNNTSIPIHQENISSEPRPELRENYTEIDDKLRLNENLALKGREDQCNKASTSLMIPKSEPLDNYTEAANETVLLIKDESDHSSIVRHQENITMTIPEQAPLVNCTVLPQEKTVAVPPVRSSRRNLNIFVKDCNREMGDDELVALEYVMSRCNRDKNINIMRAIIRRGCAVIHCSDEHTRDWLDKEIPSLVPWEGAQLKVVDVIEPTPIQVSQPTKPNILTNKLNNKLEQTTPNSRRYSWIHLPLVPGSGPLINPEKTLSKMHKQNPKVGCNKWIILHAETKTNGQLLYVRFGDKSEKVLKSMNFMLKWYGSPPIRVKMKNRKNLQNSLNQEKVSPKNNLVKNPNQELKTPNVEFWQDDLFVIAPEMNNMKMNSDSVVSKEGLLNPVDISSYSEMSLANVSEIEGRMPQLEVVAEPSTTTDWATQSNSALNQVRNVSPQLEDANQHEITESRVGLESQLLRENRSETGPNLNLRENRSSAVKYSRTEDNAGFWGIDAPRLLPVHRVAIAKDFREYDNYRESAASERTGYFKDAKAFSGRDEEYSLEERLFAARQQTCVQDQDNYRTVKSISYPDQGSSFEVTVDSGGQEYSREDRTYDERDHGTSQSRVVTEDQEYFQGHRIFDERDQGYSQEEMAFAGQDNISRGHEFSQELRSFNEPGQEYTQQHRDFDERDEGYFQEETAFAGQDNISRVHEYSQELRSFNEPGQEYTQQHRDFDERDQEYFGHENSRGNRVLAGRVDRENRFSAERGDQKYSSNSSVFDRLDQPYHRVDRGYETRDRNYRRKDRDCYQPIDRQRPEPNTHFRRSEEAWHQDSRTSYTDGSIHGSRSRGNGVLEKMDAKPRKRKMSGAAYKKAQRQKRAMHM